MNTHNLSSKLIRLAPTATGRQRVKVGGASWAMVHVETVSSVTFTFEVSGDGDAESPVYSNAPAIKSDGTQIGAGASITGVANTVYYVYVGGADSLYLNFSACTSASVHVGACDTAPFVGSGDPGAIQCYSFISDGTDELLISASARRVYGLHVFSLDATPVYVKLYDKATAPSESDTPIYRHGLLSNSTAANGATSNAAFPAPIALTNGLGVRAVTGIGDSNDSALTASECLINVFWS